MKVFSNCSCGCIISDDPNMLFVKWCLGYACRIYPNMWAGFANLLGWHADHVFVPKFRALSNPGEWWIDSSCLADSMTHWLTDSLSGWILKTAVCCLLLSDAPRNTRDPSLFLMSQGPVGEEKVAGWTTRAPGSLPAPTEPNLNLREHSSSFSSPSVYICGWLFFFF